MQGDGDFRECASSPITNHGLQVELLANIDVDDLGKAVRFYEAGLGLKPGRRLGEGVVEMLGGSSSIYLLKKASGSAASKATTRKRDYRRHWTPVHLDFVVEDIQAAARQAQTAGATREGDIQTYKWGSIARMADPFGHGFCLIQFRGRGYDELLEGKRPRHSSPVTRHEFDQRSERL